MEEAAAVVSKVVPAVAEVQQVAKRAASNKSKSWRSGKNRERLPRFAAAQKGVRLLASYRAANPQRDLPLLCRQMKVLSYDPARYGLAAAVAEGLLGFPESGNLLECMLKLEGYWLSDDEKQRQPPGKVHSRVRACTKLCDAYERLIKEVIGPDLLADFNTGHSNGMERTEDPETVLLYQFPPTLRIFCSARERDDISAGSEAARRGMTLAQDNGAVCVDIRCQDGATAVCDLKIGDTCGGSPEAQYKRLGRLHNDAQYGHQPGEVNFWLPLTRLARSNTLWAETAEERGDFQPILVEEMAFLEECTPEDPIELPIQRFHGTLCRHQTQPNSSGRTRVSLDFRCAPKSAFDASWKLPGIVHRHEMREVQFFASPRDSPASAPVIGSLTV